MSVAGTITPSSRNAEDRDTNRLDPILAAGGLFSLSDASSAGFFLRGVDTGWSATTRSARPGAGATAASTSAAPVVTLTSPNLITNTAAQAIEGSTDASFSGSTVSIYTNGSAVPLGIGTVQSDGHFSVNVTLPAQGDNILVASITTLGNGSGTSASIDEALVTAGSYVNIASTTVNGLTLQGTTVVQNKGTIVQTGNITIGDSSGALARLANVTGGTYTIAGDFNIGVGSNAASNFNNNGGTLQKTAGNNLSTISASFQNGSGAPSQIKIASGGLAFTGATSNFVGQAISGAGLFEIGGGAATIGANTTITTAYFGIAGLGTSVTLAESLTYNGFLGVQSGTTIALGTNTLTVPNFSLSPAFGAQPYEGGASAVAGGTNVVPASTVITAAGGGRIVTAGGYGGIGNVVLGGALVWNNTGLVTATGTAQFGDASGQMVRFANSTGGTYNLVLDAGIAVGTNTASNFNNNGGTFAKVSGTGTSLVAVNFQDGNAAAAQITVKSGTLQFNGAVNSFVAQAISGAGTFAIGGGGTSAIGSGTTIATSAWTIAKAGTSVTLAQNLGFAGSFSATNATTLALGGNSLTLSGAAAFNLGPAGSPLVTGSGKLITSGADTIGGLALGGSTLFRNNGSVSQTGTVTLGDSSNGSAQITDAGSWAIAGDVGIVKGSTAAVFNTGGGTLTKTAGSGTSTIATALVNLNTATSKIEVASGTLDFAGPVSGANAFAIDAGRTLAFEASVATGSAVRFAGAGGTLLLNDAQDFKGSIAGFGANQTLDLGSIGYSSTGTTLAFSGSTLTVSDGTRTASLAIGTGYSQASFHLASDTHGGSLVTYG